MQEQSLRVLSDEDRCEPMCSKDWCPIMIKGQPVYKDEEHLRRQTVIRKWKPLDFIDKMLKP